MCLFHGSCSSHVPLPLQIYLGNSSAVIVPVQLYRCKNTLGIIAWEGAIPLKGHCHMVT